MYKGRDVQILVFRTKDIRGKGRQRSASVVSETFDEVLLLSKLEPTLASDT